MTHPVTVSYQFPSLSALITGFRTTIFDTGGGVVATQDVTGQVPTTFPAINPGSYTVKVWSLNHSPDPAHPTPSANFATGPFNVADANATPPDPTGVTVTVG